MIKKLRIKLIAVSMLSLLVVLLAIMGTVNAVNYNKIVADADTVLDVLNENGGSFPKPENNFVRDNPKHMSPELPYESRYFCVNTDESGQVISADTGKIAAIDTKTAMEYAGKVIKSDNERGFIGNYRYIKSTVDDGVRVIFLDCGRNLSTFRTFLLTSCGISLAGMLAVLVLMILLSRRIVRPVSESYEKQKQFITDAGHEIKTPITIIDADAEVMKLETGENEWLSDIQAQAKRLALLTNDLISLSRMEEEKPRLQLIEFPLSDLVSETAQSFRSLAVTQNKTFTSDIRPMLSVYGDEKALRQLVSILLDNALKYSPENGEISLGLDRQGKFISLTVENTADLPRESLDYLFDRFYREDKSRNSHTGGYGIGLSIAKAIVTAHKGRISASGDGKSLLITVTLPAKSK